MFVSYGLIRNKTLQYGYMCFKGEVTINKLTDYLKDTLFVDDIDLICVTEYSHYSKHYVRFYQTETGLYKTIKYRKPLGNVEDIGTLYSYLYRKYGFCNILNFIPA